MLRTFARALALFMALSLGGCMTAGGGLASILMKETAAEPEPAPAKNQVPSVQSQPKKVATAGK